MKEVRTIKMVEQTEIKFIADDGKEFCGYNAENDCRQYELQNNAALVKDNFERLNTVKIDFPLLDWFCDESEFWKIKLESKKDYFSMIDYFKIVHNRYTDIGMPKEYPYTMHIILGYEDAWEYCGNIEKMRERMRNALELI